MTDRELKKLKRSELLQMLLEQSKLVEALKSELEQKNKLLEERKIILENSGSIAEAALKLNNIFQVAQQAADQYLLSIKHINNNENNENNEKTEETP